MKTYIFRIRYVKELNFALREMTVQRPMSNFDRKTELEIGNWTFDIGY